MSNSTRKFRWQKLDEKMETIFLSSSFSHGTKWEKSRMTRFIHEDGKRVCINSYPLVFTLGLHAPDNFSILDNEFFFTFLKHVQTIRLRRSFLSRRFEFSEASFFFIDHERINFVVALRFRTESSIFVQSGVFVRIGFGELGFRVGDTGRRFHLDFVQWRARILCISRSMACSVRRSQNCWLRRGRIDAIYQLLRLQLPLPLVLVRQIVRRLKVHKLGRFFPYSAAARYSRYF